MSLNDTAPEPTSAASPLDALTDRADIQNSIEILGVEVGMLSGIRRSPNPAKAAAAAKLEIIRLSEIAFLTRKLAAAA